MARKATNSRKANGSKPVSIVDVTLDLPPDVEGQLTLNIALNSKTIETTRRVTDELMVARKLPSEGQDILVADPLALIILAQDKTLTGTEAAYKASRIYEQWREDVRREALVVGMTMNTKIDREPRPYEEDDLTDDDDTPDWLRDPVRVPQPERNLTNRYEYRLKQVYDILDDAGPLFSARFESILNNDIATRLREMGIGEPTDEDGFQSRTTGAKVSDSSVSES